MPGEGTVTVKFVRIIAKHIRDEYCFYKSLALWFDITDNIGAFVETYNYLHPDGNQYMTDFGFTWMPSRRVQLDISCDLDFQNLGKYYAIGCGVSWMIN